MKSKLLSLAKRLSDNDVKELLRLRRLEDRKSIGLRKRRDKLAAEIARIDAQLAKLGGEEEAEPEARPRARKGAAKKRGRKPGVAAAAAKKTAAPRGRKGGKKGRRQNLSAAVRQVFTNAGEPLKASQVVDALPGVGVAVKDVAEMRKRISVVLASQKNHFETVERGVYRLKE